MHDLIFDLDGTLFDTAHGILKCYDLALRSVGITNAVIDRSVVIGPPLPRALRELIPLGDDAVLEEAERSYRAHYDTIGYQLAEPNTGAADALTALRSKGRRLFVATNKPIHSTTKLIEHFGFNSLLHGWHSPNSTAPTAASKSETVGNLIRAHELNTRTTILVGDSLDDAEAASAHSILFFAFSGGYGKAHEQAHFRVHRVLSHFAELPILVEEVEHCHPTR